MALQPQDPNVAPSSLQLIKQSSLTMKETVKIDVLSVVMRSSKISKNPPYPTFMLRYKNETIKAISYARYASKNYEMLQVGQSYIIKGDIRIKPRPKTKMGKQNSTKSITTWILNQISILQPSNVAKKKNMSTVAKLTESIMKGKPFFNQQLENITIESGEMYRYVGCTDCSTKRPQGEIKHCFNCKASGKQQVYETRLFMIIRHITIRDSTGSSSGLVCYNAECEKVLGKKATDFRSDEEAKHFIEESLIGGIVNLKISTSKAKRSKYGLNAFIHSIDVISKPEISNKNSTLIYEPDACDEGFEIVDDPDVDAISTELSLSTISSQDSNSLQDLITQTELLPYTYNLKSKPSGHALIVNNNEFDANNGGTRHGSKKDLQKLKETFKALDFETFVKKDLKVEEFQRQLNIFKRRLTSRDISSCAVVILSHGTLNHVQMTDGNLLNIWKDIVEEFNDKKFPKFIGRPKIFIFGACQVYPNSTNADYSPKFSDTLICFPAIPGHLSYRHKRNGSPYIIILCSMLKEYAKNYNLVEILDMTQLCLMKYPFSGKRRGSDGNRIEKIPQMSYHISLAFQKFRFNIR